MDLNETIQQELMGSEGKTANPIKITINGNNMEFESVEHLNENLTQMLLLSWRCLFPYKFVRD